MNPKVEHQHRPGHGERRYLDGGKRNVLPRQVLLPRLPGAVEAGEIGVELLRPHHVGERGAGLGADAFRLGKDVVGLQPGGRAEVRAARVDASGLRERAALVHGHEAAEKQQVAGTDRLRLSGVGHRHARVDALLLRRAALAHADRVDFYAARLADEAGRRRGEEGGRGRRVAEVARPDLVEGGHVVEVAQVDLRLDHLGQRIADHRERRLELVLDDELGLELDRRALPQVARGHARARIERAFLGLQGLRGLAGDEHVVAAGQDRAVAGRGMHRQVGGAVLRRREVVRRHDRHQLHFHLLPGEQQALVQVGGAGRDMAGEILAAHVVVGIHCARARV